MTLKNLIAYIAIATLLTGAMLSTPAMAAKPVVGDPDTARVNMERLGIECFVKGRDSDWIRFE